MWIYIYLVRFDSPSQLLGQEDVRIIRWMSNIDEDASLSVRLVHGIVDVTAAVGGVLLLVLRRLVRRHEHDLILLVRAGDLHHICATGNHGNGVDK